MEGKVSVKELVEAEEKPPHTCHNNITDASQKNDDILGSTILSLSLNNQQVQAHRIEEQPAAQLRLMGDKLEEMKRENQNLRAMLSQITQHYAALHNRLLMAMQQRPQQQSPLKSHNLQEDDEGDEEEKAALPIRHFLDIHEPSASESNKSEGLISHRNSITCTKPACEANSNNNAKNI